MKSTLLMLSAWVARRETLPPHRFALLATAVALGLSLFCFAPKFQLWTFALEGHYETTRARTFLLQCEAPLRRDIEPAMQWRLLPPAVCHVLGLRGPAALLLPWVGVVALLWTTARILRNAGLAAGPALGGVTLVATTSAVLVPVGWLGLNDAWVWTALLAAAFARNKPTLLAACVLGPWIDERFIIGLPLACAVAAALDGDGTGPLVTRWLRRLTLAALGVAPYAAVRIAARVSGFHDDSGDFLRDHLTGFVVWLPYAPLGWWMALRAAWWPVWSLARPSPGRSAGDVLLLPGLILATLGIMTVIAADLSRSAAIALPAVVGGIVALVRRYGPAAARVLAGLLVFNLAVPVVHVVYTKTDLISPLPVELARLLRKLLFSAA